MELDKLESILTQAKKDGLTALDEPTGKEILAGYQIEVPRSVVVSEGDGFAGAVYELTPPLVLKVISADVIHKTEFGGVKLNLRSVQELAGAASEIRQRVQAGGARIEAWLVEEMAPAGAEMVVGGLQDPEFGPMVMIGLGGIFVEVFEDVSFRICPIDESEARDMIDELKSSPLLKGARGKEPLALDSLVEVLLQVGGDKGILMEGQQGIEELDINPLIVSQTGAVAVDARFILKQEEAA